MKRLLFVLPLVCLLLPFTFALAGKVDIVNTPDWVVGHALPENVKIPESQVTDGVYYLFLDRQANIERDQTHRYVRVVKNVLTHQGVEKASQIYVNFDPSYEQLRFHCVKVHRDGQTFNQLQMEKITVFQRESDLERRLYNGQKTASLILEDTRPGDSIEYAFTVSGRNPVFGDRYMFEGDTAWAVPLGMLHFRWIFANDRPVFYNAIDCRRDLQLQKTSNGVEYNYSDSNIEPVLVDDELPAWYNAYPMIQLSQFENWADVARWGTALYQIPQGTSPALQAQIRELKQCATNIEKITKALCLVQNEIRYLGIEIGPGSYKPSAPDTTYNRKFGDCKDKSILLCTLLNKSGVRARPALVSTRLKRRVGDHLPSPLLFDHVIVWVVDDEKTFWIDPTGDCQRVPLDVQYQALYGKALILRKETRHLTDTGQEVLSSPSREIYEVFDLTNGVDQPATLNIKTICRGRQADRLRRQIKSSGLQQTRKSYLNFYASDYPNIVEQQTMTIDNDPDINAVVVNEYYGIPGFWQKTENPEGFKAAFHCREFKDLFWKPGTTIRSMPIGLTHPQFVTQCTTVKLPERWEIETEQGRVENSAILFNYDITYADKVLTLDYSVQSKQDFIATDQTAGYIADIQKIRDMVGYWLTWSKDDAYSTTAPSWFMIGSGLTGLIVAIGLGFIAWRYDPQPLKNLDFEMEDASLDGLGGWLLLVMVGLFVRPAVIINDAVNLLPTFKADYWYNIEDGVRPGFLTAFKVLVGGEAAINLILIVLMLLLIYLFFKKRTAFPQLFVIVILSAYVVWLLDAIFIGYLIIQPELTDPIESERMVTGALSVIVWSLYMFKSTRVRQTFKNRRTHRTMPCPSDTLNAAQQKISAA